MTASGPPTPGSRSPLDRDRLAAAEGWRYEVIDEVPSTNAALAARFREGEPPGLALVTEHQTAGRGRLDRSWVTPARSALTVSFLLSAEPVPVGRWPWLPLLAGVAVVAAVRRCCPALAAATGRAKDGPPEAGTPVDGPLLKWPNDVLCRERKLAGILLERVEHEQRAAAVVGIGLNVSQGPEDLPVGTATSLALEGAADVDRTGLLLALGDDLATRVAAWTAVGGEPAQVRSAYLLLCTTVGREVRVELPGHEAVVGQAVDIDTGGRLVLRTGAGERRFGAGDVIHLR